MSPHALYIMQGIEGESFQLLDTMTMAESTKQIV